MLMDFSKMKLGRKPINTLKARNLMCLRDYADRSLLPTPPSTVNWSAKVASFPMFGNDVHSDCTSAAYAHQNQAWGANSGRPVSISLQQVLDFYKVSCGWNGDVATDQGGDEISVLNAARKIGLGGYTLDSYVGIERTLADVKLCTYLFGGIYIGVELPLSAQTQEIWDVPPSWASDGLPGSWGGHAVNILDYDEADTLTCITWGRRQRMTWDFFAKYVEEAYALVSPEWFATSGISPVGIDLPGMRLDAERLAA
jgi:hypothetical protein